MTTPANTALGIFIGLAAAALVWFAYQILLAFFAGLLFAIFLHRVAGALRHFIPLRQQLAVLLVLVILLGLTVAVSLLFASTVASQFAELSHRLPTAWQKIISFTRQFDAYRGFVPDLNEAGQALVRGSVPLVSRLTATVSNVTSLVITLAAALVMGVYGALEPQLYLRGAVSVVPRRHQDTVHITLRRLEETLWKWLLGRFITMIVIGVLTTLALQLFGVPLALILGLLAGLLTIIPYLGPILSALPALLIGFSESPATALTILFIFAGVQIIEGNLITPMIERRIIRMPPALTIGVQLLLGVLAGPLGIMLASPLTAAAATVVKATVVDRVGQENSNSHVTSN
jgi:predicted PurR-regulated permease PerM